jgi:N-acetylneuraminic acid mutarotase
LTRGLAGIGAVSIIITLASCASGTQSSTATSTASAVRASGPPTIATPVASPPSPSPQPAQRLEAPLPVALEESAAASVGGRLYVMGGFDAVGRSLSTVYVFDGNTWSAGPRLPLGLDHAAAATLDDHLYLSGGHSYGADSARVFRLDGASWTELSPMRHARGGHELVAAGGRLWAIGGNTAAAEVSAVEAYDPGSAQWSDVAAMPDPRNHVAGFVFGSTVCAAGGRFPNTARVDCLDFLTMDWIRLADLPRPTSGAGAATLDDGSVIVMGGQDAAESRIVDQLARTASGDQWTATEPMLAPRHGFELAVFEGRAWACGGGDLAGLHPVATCTSVL